MKAADFGRTDQIVMKCTLQNAYKTFCELDYKGKVLLFDQLFSIIPFEFPLSDLELGWFHYEEKFNQLHAILETERRDRHIYEKVLRTPEGEFKFDIKPLYLNQRRYLNCYIIEKFLSQMQEISLATDKNLQLSPRPVKNLEAKVTHLTTILHWTSDTLLHADLTLPRYKFLDLFYKGYQSVQMSVSFSVSTRRKYIELFLFSQGQFFAKHLAYLRSLLEISPDKISSSMQMDLTQKIILLHKLGVLEQLLHKFEASNVSNAENVLAELICLITSEHPKNLPFLAELVKTLQAGSHSDLLHPNNLRFIEQKLADLQLPIDL